MNEPLIRLGPGGEYTRDYTPRQRCRYPDDGEWRDEDPVAVARMLIWGTLLAAAGLLFLIAG